MHIPQRYKKDIRVRSIIVIVSFDAVCRSWELYAALVDVPVLLFCASTKSSPQPATRKILGMAVQCDAVLF